MNRNPCHPLLLAANEIWASFSIDILYLQFQSKLEFGVSSFQLIDLYTVVPSLTTTIESVEFGHLEVSALHVKSYIVGFSIYLLPENYIVGLVLAQ